VGGKKKNGKRMTKGRRMTGDQRMMEKSFEYAKNKKQKNGMPKTEE